ncbi:hypothetical protein KOR42_29150 [Thalassoglobus neptunius]|uniref:Glycosyltransferase RgtA/B/C/D-like domain-containing protein n=1 Tax=Thalassoglobus neptunius TaxID=1938619 RepID=A0A5C5WXF1_9PLAN|nr:hypothetical protein [Thalassoglobus neptunius]TWT55288.1 hypothetical protein KOR42_29150 [Thalassoglobus neptunius]
MTSEPASQGPTSMEPSSRRRMTIGLWGVLAILLLINIPVVLCLHLTCDSALYDLQAQCAFDGGVLYRDMIEPNFPGIVWIHMLIRSFAGWSSVALRAVDLCVVAGIVAVLGSLMRKSDESVFSLRMGFVAVSIFALHLGLLEWCHCQRDLWMLLPCLLATQVRLNRWNALRQEEEVSRLSTSSFSEGCLWAIAFWIKPHIAVPALLVIAMSYCFAGTVKTKLRDAAGVLAGGVIVGMLGILWMVQTGAWEPFWVMQLEWNPEYLRIGRSKTTWSKLEEIWWAFSPWNWFHLIAVCLTIQTMTRFFRDSGRRDLLAGEEARSQMGQLLLMALYVGWVIQTMTLQFPFMYVHVPCIILAIGVSGTMNVSLEYRPMVTAFASFLLILMGISSPILSPTRLANWKDCVTKGPTPEVRSRIQIEPDPDWEHLEPVIEFLSQKNLQDGDVTAYSNNLVLLYSQLGLRPSTRYVFLDVLIRLFHSKHGEIHDTLEACQHRYVVSSLRDAGMTKEAIATPEDPKTRLPEAFPESALKTFPFTQPVVFRSDHYLVHEVTEPVGELATKHLKDFPDASDDERAKDSMQSEDQSQLSADVVSAVNVRN